MCYSPEDNAPLGAATFKHMMLREDLMGWTLADVVCSDHFNWLVTFILEEVTPPVEEQDAATAREALAALLTFVSGGKPTYISTTRWKTGGHRKIEIIGPYTAWPRLASQLQEGPTEIGWGLHKRPAKRSGQAQRRPFSRHIGCVGGESLELEQEYGGSPLEPRRGGKTKVKSGNPEGYPKVPQVSKKPTLYERVGSCPLSASNAIIVKSHRPSIR